MIKIFFMNILFALYIFAQTLQIDDKIPNFKIKNQFDKIINFDKNIKNLIISYDKKTTNIFNEKIKKSKIQKNYQFIIDVSAAPKPVVELFIKPVMQNYSHDILMSDDRDFNLILPYRDDDTLVWLILENGEIKGIKYFSEMSEIEKMVSQMLANQ